MLEQKDSLSVAGGTQALPAMGFTDILDGTFSLYRSHFGLFLRINSLYFSLTSFCLTVLLRFSPAVSDFDMLLSIVILFCMSLIPILVMGSLALAGAHTYLGWQISPRSVYQQVFNRFFPYLGSSLLWYLTTVVLAATVIGIPFAIYFGVRWSLYGLPVLFEGTGVRQSLKRSGQLVKGMWWRVFGISLGIFLLFFVIQTILQSNLGFALTLVGVKSEGDVRDTLLRIILGPYRSDEPFFFYVQMFIHFIVSLFTLPLLPICSTLLYFDLRIRKEGFDIGMVENSRELVD